MRFTKVIAFRVRQETKEQAQAKADSQDVSLARVIRELLKAWLREDE